MDFTASDLGDRCGIAFHNGLDIVLLHHAIEWRHKKDVSGQSSQPHVATQQPQHVMLPPRHINRQQQRTDQHGNHQDTQHLDLTQPVELNVLPETMQHKSC